MLTNSKSLYRIKVRCCIILIFSTITGFAKSYPDHKIDQLGETIYHGVFTGNGLLGTMTYRKDENKIRVDVGRTDVYDHREDGTPHLFSRARLPIGHFEISLENTIINQARGHISIQNANAEVLISTDKGDLKILTTTLSEMDFMLIEIDRSAFNGKYSIQFIPSLSRSPRMGATWVARPSDYLPNPTPHIGTEKDTHLINQPLTAGGGYTTAYRQMNRKNHDLIVATISYTQSGTHYDRLAVDQLKSFQTNRMKGYLRQHLAWWKKYMAISEYQLPDRALQQFYDLQQYKLACLTRDNRPAIDLQGPWTVEMTPWPAYWFNLNMQLTYSPVYTANRLSIGRSMINLLNDNYENLRLNIHPDYRADSYALGRSGGPDLRTGQLMLHRDATSKLSESESELSNLTWLLFYYYQHYRYTMDVSMRPMLYKLLKGSVNFSLKFIDKNQQGKYGFVVPTHSPEYTRSMDTNTNYDLSSLRWALQTLIELAQYEEKDTAFVQKIKDIQQNLIAFPTDTNGYKISQHQGYEVSHRHYSHLMMIYPYALLDIENNPAERSLARQSVDHWQSLKGALQGYSLSGAASMYAMMGDGDLAETYIKRLLKDYIQPNTLYKESGPVIETPFALAASLQELSVHHWQGVTHIFPAIPSGWDTVSFKNFRTDGAFLLTGSRDKQDTGLEIYSEHGGTLKISIPIEHPKLTLLHGAKLVTQKDQFFDLDIPAGGKVILEGATYHQ